MPTERQHDAKVYVQVLVEFMKEGGMRPRTLIWEDGRKYDIDRVLDVRPAAAQRAGGQGDRYKVKIAGQERLLFFEHSSDAYDQNVGRWFVERGK